MKMAEGRIKQTTWHNRTETIVSDNKNLDEMPVKSPPTGAPNTRGLGKSATFDK